MLDFIILLCCAAVVLGAFIFLSDLLTGELPKFKQPEREREYVPFVSRDLKLDEIESLVHQLAIMDAIHKIGPDAYWDATQSRVEELVSAQIGRKFWLDSRSWFHVARAWYATDHKPLKSRCKILDLRLRRNL